MDSFLSFLGDILSKVFTKVLQPILESFLKLIVNSLIKIIKEALAWIFYYIYTFLLRVIAFLSDIFDIFSGLTDVRYKEHTQGSVIQIMFQLNDVTRALTIITSVAFAMAIIFTIIQVIKSMSDMTLDNKNPISKVLGSAIKTGFFFLIIPLMCMFMLQLSQVILKTVDTTVVEKFGGDKYTLDRILWFNSSVNASTDEKLNVGGESGPSYEDSYRKPYVKGERSYSYVDIASNSKSEDYFKARFKYADFDYGVGIPAAVIVIIILFATIVMFIRRIFELLVLYLVGPFFVSTMPMDEGAMFKKWKDIFIAKFFSAFGSVMGMKVYLIFLPVFCQNRIQYSSEGGMFNTFVQLLFVIGGAYAVYKMQPMILKMLSFEAGHAEAESAQMGYSLFGRGASFAIGVHKTAARSMGRAFMGKENDSNSELKRTGKSGKFGGGGGSSSMEKERAAMQANQSREQGQ